MIEKINTEKQQFISEPCKQVILHLDDFLESKKEPITVAEIGVGVGVTSVEIVKRLRDIDSFYFFSFEDDVAELEADLKDLDYCNCKLYPMGNTHTTYDSYTWNLSSLYLENEDLFDLVYLDGAHTFYHDGLATALLKKLIKPGGILIFDDVFWSFNDSPYWNNDPERYSRMLENYPEEQIKSNQIKRVLDVFMENDEEWERIGDIAWKTTYKKIAKQNKLERLLSNLGSNSKKK
ncbi:class I SAM-dependent methyltransferase [Methanobrevibacter sp.]|uniref:class I SAM-dependent methyltransferase n=1 Tax=Methanobrevibacter sp. TaxID=66852 RepID=UPI003890F369